MFFLSRTKVYSLPERVRFAEHIQTFDTASRPRGGGSNISKTTLKTNAFCCFLGTTERAFFSSVLQYHAQNVEKMLIVIKVILRAVTRFGHQGWRRVFCEVPKFFKICSIFFNYAQHIFAGG